MSETEAEARQQPALLLVWSQPRKGKAMTTQQITPEQEKALWDRASEIVIDNQLDLARTYELQREAEQLADMGDFGECAQKNAEILQLNSQIVARGNELYAVITPKLQSIGEAKDREYEELLKQIIKGE